jgi:hypothetical protein
MVLLLIALMGFADVLGLVSVFAQEPTALLAGAVTDTARGAPVVGVQVNAFGEKGRKTTTTDAAGRYRLELSPGTYSVEVVYFTGGLGGTFFAELTSTHLPVESLWGPSMDAQPGDLDLVVGNEDDNRLLLNDGQGLFADLSATHLPLPPAPETTRQVDLGDVDGDGDLDLFFANLSFNPASSPNRLLLNDSQGIFTDVTQESLPPDRDNSFDGSFVDLDGDGDLDVVTANALPGTLYRAYRNDGRGTFTGQTRVIFPAGMSGEGFDVEAADFDQDGYGDLYLCSRGGVDRLLLGRLRATAVEEEEGAQPFWYRLYPNYPNPFNPSTTFRFSLSQPGEAELSIYNPLGQQVALLVDGWQEAGEYRVMWEGQDAQSLGHQRFCHFVELAIEMVYKDIGIKDLAHAPGPHCLPNWPGAWRRFLGLFRLRSCWSPTLL